jgi:excisionase family DNA binding protein
LVERMLTVSEVADLLRVHSSSVRRWQKSGELKSYRLGSKGSLRFKNEDILSFLQAANRADGVSGAGQSLPEQGTAN